jgi:alpha-glucosidase (family GH31 glycosyl hydrolase)
VISWKSLDFQPYFNSTASNVLYGYWSHDLGGHIGSQIDPEMYTRWLQFGALSPIMRTHSQKGAKLNKEPWVFDKEYCDIIRETIRQRYVMAPYIYTMARKGYDDGLSLVVRCI